MPRGGGTPRVKTMENDQEDTEIFQVSNSNLDESQLVILKLELGNYLHFHADTDAQCNVVP